MFKKLLIVLVALISLYSCKRDTLFTGKAQLEFSTDTVFFDTVFTTIGSITERVIVRNPYDQPIEITKVYLEQGQGSNFKMNVDGIQGRSVSDIRIEANDSIFIFVEVTVDPNGGTTPMIIEEFLNVETEENTQSVSLVAWGQDAYFFPSVAITGGEIFQLPVDKPIVFYGYSIVDTASTLIIPCGARVHFHSGSGLIVGHQASLKIQGCPEDPVIIQGDRLEDDLQDTPGQWDQILLSSTSIDNEVRNAIIKNGQIGIRVDSNTNQNPSLILENTQIINMSVYGLLAQDARVEATNTVLGNCGNYTVALAIGGDYTFQHCTFGNVWSEQQNPRSSATLYMNNFFEDADENVRVRDFNAVFQNTIVYGTLDEELEIALDDTEPANYLFENCVLKTEEDTDNDNNYLNCVINPVRTGVQGNPVFVNPGENDYHLIENSQAIDAGLNLGITLDLDQVSRDTNPDIGAYEYVPEEE